ncbi:fibronectin type III domain-containing protein [Flavobacterium cerinum]|uniref:Fibronectin type III domain-containing protein n=1 Tax=Flavobacterium cerinum TaxID=2502784 RepID=A0ABY5IS67_9FLAO|nr:fibronectin type III domain-containing protein [Flavobacterium cerinum]UUC45640.1 fibronectin type III domain-containing protein [Flavobacterium cerinum]
MKKTTFLSKLRWRDALKLHLKLSCLLWMALLMGYQGNAQGTQTTVLINPTAEGGFENGSTFAANGWTTVNAAANTWNVGTVPGWFSGTGGAYISNDTGTTWAYTNSTANRSIFYRDVVFPAGVTAVNLKFDWRGNGNDGNWDNLQVYIIDTSITPTTAGPTGTDTTTTGWATYVDGTTGYYLLRQNGTAVPTTTTNITYNLTAGQRTYVDGKTKRLVFVWKNDGSGGTNPPASVDNISLTATAVTCVKASAVVASAITTTSATISWTASVSNPANGYEYEVRTSGAAGSGATGLFTSGTTGAGVTTTPLSGLTNSTVYTVYVRANCGSGDFSDWTAAYTFTTLCDTATIPYVVPINAVTVPAIPACTTVQNVNNDTRTWVSYASVTGITGKVMGYPYHGSNAANDWFFTNGISLTQGTSYRLKFKYKDSGYAEKLKVGIGSTAVNTAMTTTLFDVTTGVGTTVVTKEIDFTVPTTGVYNIGFQCYSAADMSTLYLGEISVELTPSCLAPTALTATGTTTVSTTIGWTAPATAPAAGYEYEIRTTGAAGSGATGLATSGSTAAGVLTANIASLTPSTDYFFYVRSNCGSGSFSAWTAAGTFRTGYCVPSSTSSATYINSFTTTGGSTNISNTNSGYATNGYQDNYATGAVTQYPTGTVNFATTIVGGTVGTSIWVDWNNDLVFDNTTERVFVTTAYGNNQTGSFVIPAGTAIGDYRMRVRIDYNNSSPDACASTNTRTEAEDYKLTVVAIPSCLAPTAVTATANTAFTATVNWTVSVSTPSNGYELYHSTSNTTPAVSATPTATAAAGAVTAPLTGLNPASTYYVWVRSNCGTGNVSAWTLTPVTFTTPCDPPVISATTPASICGQGTATLGATASTGTVNWYAAQTGGVSLGSGASFTTPVITATTSYWVDSSVLLGQSVVGPVSPTAQGGTTGTQTTAWEVNFTVLKNTKLISIDIFPQTTGQTGAIAVRNASGTVIATYPFTTNVSGGATAQTITLDHTLVPGNYQLYPTLPTAGLMRNTTGAVYPYTSSVANITGNGYDPVYYMGIYNWKFDEYCTSARTEVVATVTTPPALTLSTASTTAVCSGQSSSVVTVTAGASSYDTYVWAPATGVTGDATNGWTFNPSATTTYTLTASNSTNGCNINASVVVNINPNPIVNATATPATICEGTSTTLAATTTVFAPGTITIGTGTTLSGDTTQPTAFCNRWKQYWNQTVFTAAELTAAGLKPGNITSIAYNITSLGSGTNVTNFTVRIGTTTASTMTAFTTTGLNLVYGPATYTHAIGLNTITFATPYVWDGVSNIIVDIRQEGADSTYNAITYYTATADNTTASATTSTLPSVTVLATSNPTPSLSKNRLNIVFGGQVASTGAGDLTWNWMPGNLTGSSVSVSPATTTTYTVRGTNPTTGCYTESTVTVNVTAAPAAPAGSATQAIHANTAADATIEDITVTGTAVVWYPTEADAIANTNALAAGTQLVHGNTYYAMQTVGGCRSVTPLAVTVTLTLSAGSFDMLGLKYYPNPVVDVFTVLYTNDITSVEVFNLVGQRVIAVQPNATTASVDMSALPTGAYILQVKANGQSQSIKVIKK